MEDFSSVTTFPSTKTFVSNATANRWTEVKLPKSCGRIQVGSSVAAKIAHTGTDGGTIAATDDQMFIPANNVLSIHMGRGNNRNNTVYIGSSGSSSNIHILFEEM
tara:strand:- start:18473 stop:18787 length:315 start_codon:yes stop_codon:yes gene_type:complete